MHSKIEHVIVQCKENTNDTLNFSWAPVTGICATIIYNRDTDNIPDDQEVILTVDTLEKLITDLLKFKINVRLAEVEKLIGAQ